MRILITGLPRRGGQAEIFDIGPGESSSLVMQFTVATFLGRDVLALVRSHTVILP